MAAPLLERAALFSVAAATGRQLGRVNFRPRWWLWVEKHVRMKGLLTPKAGCSLVVAELPKWHHAEAA